MNALTSFDGPVSIKFAAIPALTEDYWERRAITSESRLETAHDAVRCAADWLRMQAPGRALEVLENNMR